MYSSQLSLIMFMSPAAFCWHHQAQQIKVDFDKNVDFSQSRPMRGINSHTKPTNPG